MFKVRQTFDNWVVFPDPEPAYSVEIPEDYVSGYNKAYSAIVAKGWYKSGVFWFSPDGTEKYLNIYKAYRVMKLKELIAT